MTKERFEILGVPVDNISRQEALSYIIEFLDGDKPHFAVAINPEKIMTAINDPVLLNILRKSDINFVDGVGVAWVSRVFLKRKIKERITGIDLFGDILSLYKTREISVFLLGARQETIEKAAENLSKAYPGLKIKGFHNGYFEDETEIVEMISKSKSNVLFVGMGSPKQEEFILRHLEEFDVKFAMGVGGTFNVYAGEFKRAPAIIQKLGLEWLYRFILDPKRLPRVLKLPKFIILILKNLHAVKDEVNFLNIKISNRSMEDNLILIEKFIKEKGFHLIVTLNGEMAARSLDDADFMDILRKASLVVPDGVGIVWGARRFGERIRYRIPGIEFAWELLRLAEKEGYSVYFLGAKQDVLDEALNKIRKEFPSLVISGSHHGYFTSDEKILMDLREKRPDILFIGMGGIKQEKWIYAHKDLEVPVCMGIGGSFDVWAGKVKRAPKIVRKFGLEWLYRTVIQPSRLSRTKSLFVFAFRIIFKRV